MLPKAHLGSPQYPSTLHELEQYVESALAGCQFKAPETMLFYHSPATDSTTATTKALREPNHSSPIIQGKEEEDWSITGLRRLLLSLALIVTSFIYGMNATIIGNAQIFIAEEFDEPSKLGWIGVSFALGFAVALLPLSKASRLFDGKWLCLGCLVAFTSSMALCGGAPSIHAVIVGRAFTGASGAGLVVTNAQMFARFTMRADHSWYGFTTTSIAGAGSIIGPVVSGALCESSKTWRWAFYVQMIALTAVIPAYLWLLPSVPTRASTPFLMGLRSMDLLGTLLLSGALASFALAFTSGGSLYTWSSGRTIASITSFGLCTVLFLIAQWSTASSKRLIPAACLGQVQMVLLFVTGASASAALHVSIYYIPVHFLYILGDDANVGALRVIPFVSFWWWLLVVCGAALPRIGYPGVWYLFSGLCLTAGGATMYTVRADTTPQAIAGFMVLYILGLLTSETQSSIGSAIIALREEELGPLINKEEYVKDFFGFAQALGGMVGLVVASAVFQNGAFTHLSRGLDGHGFSEEQVRGAITGVRSALWQRQVDVKFKSLWLDSLVRGVDNVWMLAAVAGGVYTVCAYCMSRKRFIARSENR